MEFQYTFTTRERSKFAANHMQKCTLRYYNIATVQSGIQTFVNDSDCAEITEKCNYSCREINFLIALIRALIF